MPTCSPWTSLADVGSTCGADYSPCTKNRPVLGFEAVSYTHLDVYKRQAYLVPGLGDAGDRIYGTL